MSKRREYNIWKDGWVAVNYDEWVAAVKTGNRASIVQILGRFGKDRNFLQICTGLSNRRNHPPGEWESRVWDCYLIDLVNPLYCRGSIEAIEAMHARALSIARQWRRNYVGRPVHYSENLLGVFGEEGSIQGISQRTLTLRWTISRKTAKTTTSRRTTKTTTKDAGTSRDLFFAILLWA